MMPSSIRFLMVLKMTRTKMAMPMSRPKRTILKLYCPSLSKTVRFAVSDEEKLDLGSVARTFELEPSTLKLNCHFISRGADLISSSVTWRSLLSFFSAKGLSTGIGDDGALVVEGKPCKVGHKRAHDTPYIVADDKEVDNIDTGPPPEVVHNNKRLKDGFECEDGGLRASKCNPIGYKRNKLVEDVLLLKRLKIDEDKSGLTSTVTSFNGARLSST